MTVCRAVDDTGNKADYYNSLLEIRFIERSLLDSEKFEQETDKHQDSAGKYDLCSQRVS